MSLNDENFENDIKIEQYIKNLPFRYNLDFTDFLWELLIRKCILRNACTLYIYLSICKISLILAENSNYFEMTECIHTVLKEILINDRSVQV